jgi:hypothetical protein
MIYNPFHEWSYQHTALPFGMTQACAIFFS